MAFQQNSDTPRRWEALDIAASECPTAGGTDSTSPDTPLARLSRGEIPAIIVRKAIAPDECRALLHHFAKDGRYPDDFLPFLRPENIPPLDPAAPAPAFSEGTGSGWQCLLGMKERFDVGSSLGNLGNDKEIFFKQAQIANELCGKLFGTKHQQPTRGSSAAAKGEDDGKPAGILQNPISVLHTALADLSGGKSVGTPTEPPGAEFAGQPYGPAIFRSHLPGFGYAPHIDSVVHREKRVDYAVHRHSTQLGGILLLQSPHRVPLEGKAKTPGYTKPPVDAYHDTILYHAPCTEPTVKAFIASASDTGPKGAPGQMKTAEFREFAASTLLESFDVDLEVGDLYFFKADSIHEVPAFGGELARMNMATFIGFDEDGDDVSVWC